MNELLGGALPDLVSSGLNSLPHFSRHTITPHTSQQIIKLIITFSKLLNSLYVERAMLCKQIFQRPCGQNGHYSIRDTSLIGQKNEVPKQFGFIFKRPINNPAYSPPITFMLRCAILSLLSCYPSIYDSV